ncbi:hypothetical protein Pan44_52130 [Caulifigura coniformis]|uniref:Twin-arginine translocation signal domain-containing protein n=1 Tax=Caulifigura coniformis TaxID=2527983 RepID=A0A517SLY8_9PLAN|nr:hypothetical protein [Caulifigura coniformis]QDT57146.1 hypothetical protein Pan44_52130 [Caulifigura coniformis]
MSTTRRRFLQAGLAGAAGLAIGRRGLAASETSIPVRAITRGPKHHWFAYYDKLQFDPTNRYVLSNEVDFEHRTPEPTDVINVGMVDIQDGDRWIELGQSRAWGWQQGCMLQWIPGSDSRVIWNDREGDQFVSRIHDVRTKETRTLPSAIYTISPDGRFAITADFARIQSLRPGYGYVGLPDQFADQKAPKESGIFRVDLETGERKLILSLHDIAQVPVSGEKVDQHWHWFNHLLISPDSKRFTVLNRWRAEDPATGKLQPRWQTRMLTASVDGGDLAILKLSTMISHFIWKDPEHISMWTKPLDKPDGFYVVKDRTSETTVIGEGIMTRDGHLTYIPGHPDWILNDSYPDKVNRNQVPYLFHVPTGKKVELGAFHSPLQYTGEWRCDTHPRASNDGRLVTIDSPHGGNGRQLYLIDVSGVLNS